MLRFSFLPKQKTPIFYLKHFKSEMVLFSPQLKINKRLDPFAQRGCIVHKTY